jgi:hypothetical protein
MKSVWSELLRWRGLLGRSANIAIDEEGEICLMDVRGKKRERGLGFGR